MDEVVKLQECEVYSYLPDMEDDPFSQANLWSFNYFFFNRQLKRILYFTCIARSKYLLSSPQAESEEEEVDDEGADAMAAMGDLDEEADS